MGFEGFPFIVGWELTLDCNLICRHCASSAGLPRPKELTLKEALKICDQFPALLVQEVYLTGGEPLLRPDWAKIAAYLNELEIKTKILTNGLILNQDIVENIKHVGIACIGISLDGLEPTHDYIRQKVGLYRKVLDSVDLVLNSGIPLTIITTVNDLNIYELPSLYKLLQSKAISKWQIQPIIPLGRANNKHGLNLSIKGYLQLRTFVQQYMTQSKNQRMELKLSDNFGYFTELDAPESPWQGCNAGWISCGITSNGKIKGCLALPDEFIEGDLQQQDLWDIWFHPKSFAYTRDFSKADLGNNCVLCDRAEQCFGGCSAMSYGSTKCFHNDPYCFYRIRT